jgi:predicted phage terminase large subunit-like protein
MGALQFVDVPGYAALLLRRTFSDLEKPESLIPRSHEWLGPTPARWHGTSRHWSFPSGATLSFGHLDTDNDVYQYQSAAYQFIGFDELTQFNDWQFRYLFSRLRRPEGMNVPLRMRAGSNPGGIGHRWVKERFIREGRREGRWFIPSRLADNPFIDQVAYRASLAKLDHITRRQLEDGDWEVTEGGLLFKRHWFEIVAEAPRDARRVRYWDLAATKKKDGNDPDWTAGALIARTADGVHFIEDIRHNRDAPLEVERLIAQTAALDGPAVEVVMEQEPGASGVITIDHYRRRVLSGFDFHEHKSDANKLIRARPLSSAAEAGNVKLVCATWNNAFLDEVELFPTPGEHDDMVDAASGAHERLNAGNRFFVMSG